MSVITISFYHGETGKIAAIPSDFDLHVFPPGSEEIQDVTSVKASGDKYVGVTKPGIFTVHFSTVEKIVSLKPETPGDTAMLLLDGEEARAYFDIYLWDLKPDSSTPLPLYEGPIRVSCSYCDSRYMTPGTPYYRNLTWYNNCYTNPPCT